MQPTQQLHVALKLRRFDRFRRRWEEIDPFLAFGEGGHGVYCPLVEYHFKTLMFVRFLEVWGRVNTDLLQRGYNCTPKLRQNFASLIEDFHTDGRLIKTGDSFRAARFSAIYPHIPRLPSRGRWRIWEIARGLIHRNGENCEQES